MSWKATGGLGLEECYDLMKVLKLPLTAKLKIECREARIEARRPVRRLDPRSKQETVMARTWVSGTNGFMRSGQILDIYFEGGKASKIF